METDTTVAARPLEALPAVPDAVKSQLRAALARRRARPVAAGLLRHYHFPIALPQSCRPGPRLQRGGLFGRLLRRVARVLLALRGARRQRELGPGGSPA